VGYRIRCDRPCHAVGDKWRWSFRFRWFKMPLMKIYLDDEPTSITGTHLSDILAAAQQQLESTGRSIVEIQVDGHSLSGDDLSRYLDGRVSLSDGTVHLYSADPSVLAVEVLQQVQQQLDVARDEQSEAAEAFQQDNAMKGITHIGNAIAIWQQVQQAVTHGSAMANLNLDEKVFEDVPVPQHIQELLEKIRQLRDLLQQRDTLGLADMLAYEWPPTLDLWQRLVGQVILWIQE